MICSPEHVNELFDYLLWADRKIIESAGTVSDEGYFRDQNISFGSLHKLLVHAMAAQLIWLTRWKGTSPARMEDAADHRTRAALQARWNEVHEQLLAFVAEQTPESLERVVQYHNTQGKAAAVPLVQLMTHVVDHGTYHRGQLNSMIKLAGGKPSNIGYVGYQITKLGQA